MNPAIAKQIGLTLHQPINLSSFENKTAPVVTRDGHPIRLFTTQFREPLFKNGYIKGVRNSIEFQNTGNTTVIINGNWTLLPGGSKKFDASNDIDVNSDQFTIYFPADPFNGLGGNRLEVCEIVLCDTTVAFFRSKGIEYGSPGQ